MRVFLEVHGQLAQDNLLLELLFRFWWEFLFDCEARHLRRYVGLCHHLTSGPPQALRGAQGGKAPRILRDKVDPIEIFVLVVVPEGLA